MNYTIEVFYAFKLLYYNTENTLSLTSTSLLFCWYLCSHFNSMFQVKLHTHALFRVLIIIVYEYSYPANPSTIQLDNSTLWMCHHFILCA